MSVLKSNMGSQYQSEKFIVFELVWLLHRF